jgi:hypothetical protein
MQTTISPPSRRDRSTSPVTAPDLWSRPEPDIVADAPARPRFDGSRARQRFTSLLAIVALILSVVSVSRSTETSAQAEETSAGDPSEPTIPSWKDPQASTATLPKKSVT